MFLTVGVLLLPTELGDAFAKMYIPAFGQDYQFAIVEGVHEHELRTGPGHYPDTQLPGQDGNFAAAGHRVGKGAPFNDLGALEACDAVVVETKPEWVTYRVLPMSQDPAARRDEGANCLPAPLNERVAAGDYARVRGARDYGARQHPGDQPHAGGALHSGGAGHGRSDHADNVPPAVLQRGAHDHPRGAHRRAAEEPGRRPSGGHERGAITMYAALWRKLPGPAPVKWLPTLILLTGLFFLLMEVVFPWVSSLMPYNDVAV